MKMVYSIKRDISACFLVWKCELQNVYGDGWGVYLFIVVSVTYFLLYGVIYSSDRVYEAPLVVVDESHSVQIHAFVRGIDASSKVQVLRYVASLEEAKESVKRKEAYSIIVDTF
jgi:ABC-2 type transport system permease protein